MIITFFFGETSSFIHVDIQGNHDDDEGTQLQGLETLELAVHLGSHTKIDSLPPSILQVNLCY